MVRNLIFSTILLVAFACSFVSSELPTVNSEIQEAFSNATCPSDVRKCLGGKILSRVPPLCEFEACPKTVPLSIVLVCSILLIAFSITICVIIYRRDQRHADRLIL